MLSLKEIHTASRRVIDAMGSSIAASEELTQMYLVSLFAGGHLLLVGPPGVAKTRSATVFSRLLDLPFKRIQFTADLLPSDITGVEVYDPKKQTFSIRKGPLFASFVLADEINRAPSKVQSALLEAMQESHVTIANETLPLPIPFFVVATMNPYDGSGTYPLPTPSLDRFLLSYRLDYPAIATELEILRMRDLDHVLPEAPLVNAEYIGKVQAATRSKVYVDDKILAYVTRITEATRLKSPNLAFGVSPRWALALVRSCQALAAIENREYVIPEDVKMLAHSALDHRIGLSYEAEAKGLQPSDIIEEILQSVPVL